MITISIVQENDIEAIQAYVMSFRAVLFPMLDNTKWPKDIQLFKEIYIEDKAAVFLQAKDDSGMLIGVIGMMTYDERFSYLDYKRYKTVEVARLFVEPKYRRTGLGSQLFSALLEVAKQKQIEMLYLHTHAFLTGAFEYWLKQGFQLECESQDGDFTTIHMSRVLG